MEKCDRCGKVYERNPTPKLVVDRYFGSDKKFRINLCDACQNKMIGFLLAPKLKRSTNKKVEVYY